MEGIEGLHACARAWGMYLFGLVLGLLGGFACGEYRPLAPNVIFLSRHNRMGKTVPPSRVKLSSFDSRVARTLHQLTCRTFPSILMPSRAPPNPRTPRHATPPNASLPRVPKNRFFFSYTLRNYSLRLPRPPINPKIPTLHFPQILQQEAALEVRIRMQNRVEL